MRLLFLNHNISGRSTFIRAHQLGRELVRRGHQVTLVTTSPSARRGFRRREVEGVIVLEAPDLLVGSARNGWDLWNTLSRVWRLRAADVDLIHGFDSRPVVIGPALAVRRRSSAPLVLDWADWWGRGGRILERRRVLLGRLMSPLETWFEERFRTAADGATVISRALERRIVGLGMRPGRVVRVPNGSDCDNIRPGMRREARVTLGVPPDVPLLLYMGMATPGDEALLQAALERVRRRYPRARLARLGSPGPPAWDAATGVIRTGYVAESEKNRWLAASDLCLIAMADTLGNRGRWPGKINDYLAAGRPVVMTRVGDAPAYLDGFGGGWSTAATAVGLGEGIIGALGDRERLEEAGHRARELAETELSWERAADQVEQSYGRVS